LNTRSLKFRLIAWYAGWLSVLFIVFGFFVYAGLGHYLEKSLRELLARRAEQVVSTVETAEGSWDSIGEEIHRRFAPEASSRFIRITVAGKVLYRSGAPADASFDPETVPLAANPTQESLRRIVLPDHSDLFVQVLPATINNRAIVVEFGSSTTPIRAALREWLTVLALGLALLILVAIFGGYWLVQRALEPVDRITRSAERISSLNLGERLPIPDTGDELERLSTALNNMIRQLDEGLQHTQRFLADASHELRTPLTMLQAELESVVENAGKESTVGETAGSALEEVDRLKKIVEGLFALSRLEAGEAQEESVRFDLSELITTTTDQMCLLAQDRNISIACDAPEKVMVEGDRARLKQVIVNLLDNAIKYTLDGGAIRVRVFSREDRAVLEVSDNGIGIPAEAVPHVFDRFFRVDKARSRAAGGAGLGLSIVKSICAAHGGSVSVQSREGQGSRFIVELPLADEDEAEA
jgi:two-component system, OmpR family, sensor kinase